MRILTKKRRRGEDGRGKPEGDERGADLGDDGAGEVPLGDQWQDQHGGRGILILARVESGEKQLLSGCGGQDCSSWLRSWEWLGVGW